jgi:hypothetical protein
MTNSAIGGHAHHLLVVTGYGLGRRFALKSPLTRIGRDAGGDVVIPDATVSFRHAVISSTEHNITIEDLGSRNGTFVGLNKVKRRDLVDGDVLAFGECQALKFVCATEHDGEQAAANWPIQADSVGNVPRLLHRLRVERNFTEYQDALPILVFIRLDLPPTEGDGPTASEIAMREIAGAICGTFSSQDLCIRSAALEYIVALRSSIGQANEFVGRARAKALTNVAKSVRRATPFGISVALLPLGNMVELAPSEILEAAGQRARIGMADLVSQIVVLPALAASQL